MPRLLLMALLALPPAAAAAQDALLPGVSAHSGTEPVELTAWAERMPTGLLQMAGGTLRDIPSMERVYRVAINLPNWKPVGMWASTEAIFFDEFTERRRIPLAFRPINVYATLLRATDVETVEAVATLMRRLGSSGDTPVYAFVTVESNAGLVREYPVRLTPGAR